MPEQTQSMSDFLDDLWSNLDNSPARQQPAGTAYAAPPQNTLAQVPIQQQAAEPNQTTQQDMPPVQDQSPPQPVQRQQDPAHDPRFVAQPAPAQPVPQAAPQRAQPQAAVPRREQSQRLFYPKSPKTLRDAGISVDMAGRLILKLLAARGAVTGRNIAAHIKLSFPMVEAVLNSLRKEQLVALKGDAMAGDYNYMITQKGMVLAKDLSRECTYFGAAPVTLPQYLEAMKLQSVADQVIRAADLKHAFSDLLLEDDLLKILGPAINSGRGMFLFGEPGNGKTSIAERISRSFGTTMWIPRALGIDGLIIRIFDPAIHEVAPPSATVGEPDDPTEIDQRWVKIQRPTVIAGGELTMSELEVCEDENTHICEAPLQLKSNGGVLLIDDFGRQRMPVDELLNRWIVPLEKRYDLLNLPSGKKIKVPFDQLVIFSTNLEPKDLVDDAFLRRIPYKVQVPNPTPLQFHALFQIMCDKIGIAYNRDAVDHLIKNHYTKPGRGLKACHPRDLLLQVRNYCLYEELELTLTRESMDFAVACYFSVLS
jgi:predicted ATPase with chaperone activity